MAVPNRMDDSVYTHGNLILPDLRKQHGRKAQAGVVSLCSTADRKPFVVFLFLRVGLVPVFFRLAGRIVGADFPNDKRIF